MKIKFSAGRQNFPGATDLPSATAPLRILATGYDYRPQVGGVATCAFETMKALSQRPGIELLCLARDQAGAQEFDRHGYFQTKRISLSSNSTQATLTLAAHVAKQVLHHKPDAILNFLWLPCGLASHLGRVAAPFGLVPYFVFVHGVEVMESSRNLRKQIRKNLSPIKRHVLRNAAGVFAVSEFTRQLVIKECGVHPDKVEVVHNGIDLSKFSPSPPAADLVAKFDLAGKRTLLTVSRLQDYKGLDRAIAALRFVVPKFPDVRYLICGEGEDRPRLEAIAQYYQVEKNVIFTGAVPFERLKDYFNLCECFVLLSRLDESKPNVEGFGIVFLEAAACGKPTIGGHSGGIPDAIEENETGWLVDPTDDRAIANAMLEVLQSPDKAARYGKQGLARAKNFTWNHVAEKVWNRIEQNVRNRGPRR
jgi:phosphatidylinositol alpha-1,6-mannosyltransferase